MTNLEARSSSPVPFFFAPRTITFFSPVVLETSFSLSLKRIALVFLEDAGFLDMSLLGVVPCLYRLSFHTWVLHSWALFN